MDAAYIKKVVGQSLVEALTTVVETKPGDPIEFVGEYLIHQGQAAQVLLDAKRKEASINQKLKFMKNVQ